MKKIRTFAGLLFFCLTISALNAQTVRQGTADVIVLMDTSGTVFISSHFVECGTPL